MQQQTQDPSREKLQRRAMACLAAGAIFSLVCWIPYLAARGGVDVLHNSSSLAAMRVVYFWMGLVLTLVAIPVSLLARRRALLLAERGIRVEGRPVKRGSAVVEGRRPVTFEYVVDGQPLRVTRDIPDAIARQYDQRSRVTIVYDPEKPSACQVLDIAANTEHPATLGAAVVAGAGDALSDLAHKAIMAGVFIVITAALFGLWKFATGEVNVIYGAGLMALATSATVGADLGLRRYRKRDLVWTSFRMHYGVIATLLIVGVGMIAWQWHDEAGIRRNPPNYSGRQPLVGEVIDPPPAPRRSIAPSERASQPSNSTPNPAPAAAWGVFTSTRVTGDRKSTTSVDLSPGGALLLLQTPDPAKPGQVLKRQINAMCARSGQSITITLINATDGQPVPASRIRRFTLSEDGKKLTEADGTVYNRE